VPAPLRVGEPVSVVDVAPTVLAMLGVRGTAPMDGIDLRDSWAASPSRPLPERVLFAEADHANTKRMARRGHWKLHADGKSAALYDLGSDQGEHRDRAGEEPERVRALLDDLDRHAAGESRVEEVTPDAASRERMRALGYGPLDE
jgi:arylsulfatase A-like enzyme